MFSNGLPQWLSGKEFIRNAGNAADSGSISGLGSVLAWEIPWTEEPGGLQSLGSQRVRPE